MSIVLSPLAEVLYIVKDQELKYLFRLYKSNQISEGELEKLFALLEKAEHDEQLKQLLDETWDESSRPIPVMKIKRLRVAAVIVLLLLSGGLYLGLHQPVRKQLAFNSIYNAAGHGPRKVVLPDSTVVWLNAASSLKYRSDTTRELELNGEAYFDVAPIADKPFIVHTGQLKTQVLGTGFNINAYDNEASIKVTVITGKVAVTEDSLVYLVKDQQAVYQRSSHSLIRRDQVDAQHEMAWKNGDIVFQSTPVPEAVRLLERRFNVTITTDIKLQKCLFFGDFNQEPLENILKMLTASVNGKLSKDNKGYHITGNGCF